MKDKIPNEFIPTSPSMLKRIKDLTDDKSWQAFFDKYRNVVRSAALKAGLSEVEADEAVQETFITIAKRIKEFQYDPIRGTFKSFLLTTARWKITDQLRKRKHQGSQPLSNPDATEDRTATIERIPDPAGFDLDAIWNEEWAKTIIAAARERIKQRVSGKQYQIFDLHVLKGWPVKKVKAALNVSAAQVYLAKCRIPLLMKVELAKLKKEFN